jgi:endogenous inhibitor of DNA gyrase (YacG/DUF329 family)
VTGAEQRNCPACGAGFTWTPAAPRQRFCSRSCRHRWWDSRRRQATAFLNRDGVPLPGSEPAPAPAERDPRGEPPRAGEPHHSGARDAGVTAAVPACPHCRKPVAVVAWLVPPAAASVATPQRHADNNA